MRPLDLWRHEWRRTGWAAVVAPPTALLLALGATALAAGGANHDEARSLLLAGPEAFVPLAVAMVAVTVVGRDGCRELQLSLPTRHLATLGRRLATLVGFAGLLCLIYEIAVIAAGQWAGPSGLDSLLVWVPPLLWLPGLAVLVLLTTRSAVLASSLVGLLWIAEELFAGLFGGNALLQPFFLFETSRAGVTTDWHIHRLVVLATGLIWLGAGALAAARPERMLTEEEA